MFIHRVSMIIVGTAFATLAACGGGGSDASSSPPPPTPVAVSLPITAANAEVITEVVLDAVASTADIVSIVDIVGLPLDGIANQGRANANANAIVADTFAETTACNSGEVTTTWNDADNSITVTTGDTYHTEFDMCLLGEPAVTFDGASSITNMIVTGEPFIQVALWSLAMTFGFDDLSVSDSEDTMIIDGSLDFTMSGEDNVLIESSIATTSLTVQHSGNGETLSDFVMMQSVDLNAMTQTISASGTFTSTELEGSVTFETLEEFLVMGDDNPSSGQLLISDNSSSVLMTVLDNISARLEIDLDLDGTIDQTLVVTWAELDVG